MRIKFYAHASFRLEDGQWSFITDPYEPAVAKFEPVGETCDAVLMSSATDRFHSYAAQVPGKPLVVDAMTIGSEGRDVLGVQVRAFPNRENKDNDAADNAMYAFALDGVRVLHMGDAGWPPTAEQVAELRGQVDVLFALAGGRPTLPLDDLAGFIAAIRPRVVIPMHFYNERGVLKILPVTALTDRYPAGMVEWRDGSTLDMTPATLPTEMRFIVLQQSR